MFRRDIKSVEKVLDFIWKSDIERINNHLPKTFKTLHELLSSADLPHVPARDGSDIYLNKEELYKIKNILPSSLHNKLKLPILLLRRLDMGRGIYQLLGSKPEAFLLLNLLGKEVNFNEVQLPLYLYRPQVSYLKRKLRTCLIIAFAFSERSR